MSCLHYLQTHSGDVPEAGRHQVRRQLIACCGRDTGGMVWIVDAPRRSTA